MHCNVKTARSGASCSRLFLANFVLRMRTNSFSALPTLPIATPISPKGPVIWRSNDVFTLWPWPLTLNFCSKSDVTWSTLYQIWPKSSNPRWKYWWFSTFSPTLGHAVTFTLTPWPWTFVVDRMSYDQTLYQIHSRPLRELGDSAHSPGEGRQSHPCSFSETGHELNQILGKHTPSSMLP